MCNNQSIACIIELDGKIYREPLYFTVKTMVSGFDVPNKTNP